MSKVLIKAYLSPSLVLLALDWPDGSDHPDFLGFAIKRTPGFADLKTGAPAPFNWLPNRLSFNGPPAKGQPDFPSNDAPVQKFLWWDARLEGVAPGASLTYEVSPVLGTAAVHDLDAESTDSLAVELPNHVEFGIGTWFNRAVMASQAFSSMCAALGIKAGRPPTHDQVLKLRTWLANSMEQPIPDFIKAATQSPSNSIAGAIYHLTDNLWIIPALKAQMSNVSTALIYDAHVQKSKSGRTTPGVNAAAISTLSKVKFWPRTKAKIMHNKFLVAGENLQTKSKITPLRLTQGSANYTTEGLTEQANLVHTFESPELAGLYLERFNLIKSDPTLANASKDAGWSSTVSIGDAGVRVFYSPEHGKPGDDSASMETIVAAVHGAKSSVIFCLFDPTDAPLRDACFSVGDAGKMMFGLVNRIATSEPTTKPTSTGKIPADQLAAVDLYHRSRDNKDTIGAQYFSANNLPAGFEPEFNLFPGTKPPPYPQVVVHHKFIVIDAETESPTIYSGSANMSGNSVFGNDENLLEMKGSARLARIYLAEFLRLYEHYRARAHFIAWKLSGRAPSNAGFALRGDRSWADQHYQPGTPEFKARVHMIDEE